MSKFEVGKIYKSRNGGNSYEFVAQTIVDNLLVFKGAGNDHWYIKNNDGTCLGRNNPSFDVMLPEPVKKSIWKGWYRESSGRISCGSIDHDTFDKVKTMAVGRVVSIVRHDFEDDKLVKVEIEPF